VIVYRDLTFRRDFVIDVPGQDVLVTGCTFANCALQIKNARRVWVERCLQEKLVADDGVGAVRFGYYIGGGTVTGPVRFYGCEARGSYLDGFKVATGVDGGVGFYDTLSEYNGAWGSSEGGGYDLFASGHKIYGSGMRSRNNHGVGLVMKSHQNLIPPNSCEDASFHGFESTADVVGCAFDAINDLDYPGEGRGDPPPTRRVHLYGPIVRDSVNEGMILGSLETKIFGGTVDNSGLQGVRFTHTARDIQVTGLDVLGAAARLTGYPLVEIKGSQRITWTGGTLDGRGIARAALELFDRDGTHLADTIQFLDMLLNGTWTAPGSPTIVAFSDVPGFIIRGIGQRPDAGPGLHGGAGSTWVRSATDQRYRKASGSAAHSLVGWTTE
jgi:hypothetical protein